MYIDQVMTPRSLVGIIIGKNGDMIKKITNETSCRIQFKPDDGQLAERACMVMGPVEGATRAGRMVQELIDKNMDKVGIRRTWTSTNFCYVLPNNV
jgi:far upstream element-binding protein